MIPTQRRRRPRLRHREAQILLGMARGMTNAEIGRELHLAEQTIKSHVQDLYAALGARNRAHAVALGIRDELVDPDDVPPAQPRPRRRDIRWGTTGRPDRPAPDTRST